MGNISNNTITLECLATYNIIPPRILLIFLNYVLIVSKHALIVFVGIDCSHFVDNDGQCQNFRFKNVLSLLYICLLNMNGLRSSQTVHMYTYIII